MQIESLGDSALILRLPGQAAPGRAATAAVLAAAARVGAAQIPGVVELAPAHTSLAIFYDPTHVTRTEQDRSAFAAIAREVTAALQRKLRIPALRSPRVVEIPVCYVGACGPDLEAVARHCGLSAKEVIARHAAAEYSVGCLGFTPGFPYLTGLPLELATPRRRTPRAQVAAGSVAIGGAQTGIYPAKSPGGWNVIGGTPVRLFDAQRTPPALLQTGDVVRFRAITLAEFKAAES